MWLDWSWLTQVPGVVYGQNQCGQHQGLANLHYKKRLSNRIIAIGLLIYNNGTSTLTLASLHDMLPNVMLPLCYPTATQQKRFIRSEERRVGKECRSLW